MTATGRKMGRRYSREQTQEDRSEGQLKERLAEVGWPCDRLGRDLGEDLHVRIYDDGASTGLSFHVQLKSAANAERLKRKKTPALAYPLEVKDLLHWEVSATLIVLVVWDVEKRTGWWRPIPEIIDELDEGSKGWRKKKTATVTVPLANGTDAEGMKRLRWAVADHSLPLVPEASNSKLTLSFPNTPDGAASLAALNRAFDEDEAVELQMPKIEYEEWHRRIYGNFDGPARIRIGRSKTSLVVPARIDFESAQGTASIPYVELRPRVWGRRKKVLSNEQQDLPVQIHVEIAEGRVEASLKLVRSGRDVYEAQEGAAVGLVMAQGKVQVRLTMLTKERPTSVFLFDEPSDEAALSRLREWLALVDKLAFIQSRLPTQRILISDDGMSHEDATAIDRVFTILSTGEEHGSRSVVTPPHERPPQQRRLLDRQAYVSVEEGQGKPIKFLNAAFEPGPCRVVLVDPVAFFAEWDRQLHDTQGTAQRAPIKLEQVPVVYEWLKWAPEKTRWDRLAQLAVRQEGYVTRSQVRYVGYTDEVFFALSPHGKVQEVATDVFHLAQFPRSDYEELITLWLQTDRHGVLSHDTALLLHEMSDILPRRRHITVPPGWDPGDRKLDSNVVLHHDEINEDEIRWIGPVPYTAPLRTLRDCIASHLSPDLIEQAIADGLHRGFFTEADLPPTAHRGAA